MARLISGKCRRGCEIRSHRVILECKLKKSWYRIFNTRDHDPLPRLRLPAPPQTSLFVPFIHKNWRLLFCGSGRSLLCDNLTSPQTVACELRPVMYISLKTTNIRIHSVELSCLTVLVCVQFARKTIIKKTETVSAGSALCLNDTAVGAARRAPAARRVSGIILHKYFHLGQLRR
ncbi:hypothetical protein EVAR_41804_1 [Eumeta japonica]|uniref:Uncharacterized protein n=1 Tax=Eumeta variegata TaxID=151549 RepID=A0A4C1W1G2_EUMVA|nr:hypothetical protein EVAR_41804_1 [Eumeta japonica]